MNHLLDHLILLLINRSYTTRNHSTTNQGNQLSTESVKWLIKLCTIRLRNRMTGLCNTLAYHDHGYLSRNRDSERKSHTFSINTNSKRQWLISFKRKRSFICNLSWKFRDFRINLIINLQKTQAGELISLVEQEKEALRFSCSSFVIELGFSSRIPVNKTQ